MVRGAFFKIIGDISSNPDLFFKNGSESIVNLFDIITSITICLRIETAATVGMEIIVLIYAL